MPRRTVIQLPFSSSSKNPVNTPQYRVIAITRMGFGSDARVEETLKWQGASTTVLSREFPPSDIFGADPLGHSEIEDGWIRFDYRFEKRLPSGEWEETSDPRRRITPMTSYEREIDAENRRRFPGDYDTDDGYDEDDAYDQVVVPWWNHDDESDD